MPVQLITHGDLEVGYQAEDPVLNVEQVTITGPESKVEIVDKIQATLDITQAIENITRTMDLVALDVNGNVVENVTITPDQVTIDQAITQKYGYRNVIVSVQGGRPGCGRLSHDEYICISPGCDGLFPKPGCRK